MPKVPVYTREVSLSGKALPYDKYNTNENTFGGGLAKATINAADGLNDLGEAAIKITEQIDDAKMLELSNQIDQWEQTHLHDKNNGYYYKTGKDAVGQAENVMNDFDKFIESYKSKADVSRFNQIRLNEMITRKRARLNQGVQAHDHKQTEEWAKSEGEIGFNNAIKGMVNSRNNPNEMQRQLNNALKIVEWQGQTQNLDADTVKAMKLNATSTAHCAVLDSYIAEGSLLAGDYFEQHKAEIHSKHHPVYMKKIKDEEMKYQARNIALDIVGTSATEEEAIKKAEAIEDIDLSDMTLARVKKHYANEEHFKNIEEREALNNFYNTAVQAAQNGQTLSYDDIPDNIDPKTKLSLMSYVNQNGQPQTDDETWEYLYNMSVNNAQGFAQEDLNKYRGFLSESEYKSFLKKQEDIKTGNYFTKIQDDNKMINAALKEIGLDKNSVMFWGGDKKDIAFSEIRSMVREFEARKGRKITDEELMNITNSLGYKDQDGLVIYKQLEKGMRERTGFVRDIINDFTYYQSKHNGEMPPDDEKMKIINYRISNFNQQKNEELINSLDYKIQQTQAKPLETKELTYYADKYLPQLGQELGVKFTIVEGGRARKANGKYISKHETGEAADVSMSEHKPETRIQFIEAQVSNPQVKAIGTSDPIILAKFKGNPKIVDERKFDRQHGTNHVHHAHITLNVRNVRMRTPNGKVVSVPQTMVQEAIKQGGVLL